MRSSSSCRSCTLAQIPTGVWQCALCTGERSHDDYRRLRQQRQGRQQRHRGHAGQSIQQRDSQGTCAQLCLALVGANVTGFILITEAAALEASVRWRPQCAFCKDVPQRRAAGALRSLVPRVSSEGWDDGDLSAGADTSSDEEAKPG